MSDSVAEYGSEEAPDSDVTEDVDASVEGRSPTLEESLRSRTSADAAGGVDDGDIIDEEEDNNTPAPQPPEPGDDAGQDDAAT